MPSEREIEAGIVILCKELQGATPNMPYNSMLTWGDFCKPLVRFILEAAEQSRQEGWRDIQEEVISKLKVVEFNAINGGCSQESFIAVANDISAIFQPLPNPPIEEEPSYMNTHCTDRTEKDNY